MPWLRNQEGKIILYLTIFITRRCNIRCEYCRFIRTNREEVGIEEWKKLFRFISDNFDVAFVTLTGGEATELGQGLIELFGELNELNLNYAIVSNSVSLDEKFANELLNSGIKNWSFTYDGDVPEGYPHQKLKTNSGLKWGRYFRDKSKGSCEAFAEICPTRFNYLQLPSIMKGLSQEGIWSELNVLHYRKNERYADWLPNYEELQEFMIDDQEGLSVVCQELVKLRREGHRIHLNEEWLEMLPEHINSLNWKCYWLTATIDSDGSLLPCCYYQGDQIGKYKWWQLNSREVENWLDYEREQCQGCYWNCAVLYNLLANASRLKTASSEIEIKKEFRHK